MVTRLKKTTVLDSSIQVLFLVQVCHICDVMEFFQQVSADINMMLGIPQIKLCGGKSLCPSYKKS